MRKGKAITLLTIISLITAFILVMTFVRFSVGVKNYNSVLGAIDLNYDLGGGTAYTLTLSEDNEKEVDNINDVLQTIRYRLSALGYSAENVKAVKNADSAVKDYDIRIEERAPINNYGKLNEAQLASDIAIVAAFGELQFFGGETSNPSTEILTDVNVIADAYYAGSVADDQGNVSYQVVITLTQEAKDFVFSEIDRVGENKYYLAIKLGETELLSGSSALSKEYFSGNSIPIATSSEYGARQAALQIKSGGLEYKYEISDPIAISSPYGEKVFEKSMSAIGVLVVAIIVAFVVMFKGLGVAYGYSMLLFILLEIIMLIAVPGIRLSLAGVLGIIFATMVCADGFIITARKIKEDYAMGKTVKSAVKVGYKRSLMPILCSGIVCGLVGLVIFAFVGGSIKCFGITFAIGSVISVVANLLFGKLFTSLFLPLVKNKEKFLNLKRDGE